MRRSEERYENGKWEEVYDKSGRPGDGIRFRKTEGGWELGIGLWDLEEDGRWEDD